MKTLLKNLFGTKTTQAPRKCRHTQFRPAIEALEGRALLAARVFHPGLVNMEWEPQDKFFRADLVRSGVMTITSDSAGDHVQIFKGYNRIDVYINRPSPYNDFGAERWLFEGPTHLVTGIKFEGNGGNDRYENFSDINDVSINGGSGNDTLIGGFGQSVLRGGADNDWLYLRTQRFGGAGFASAAHGEGGDDHIYGSSQRDYLTGGSGGDWLEGAEGNDLLVGGTGGDVLLGGDGVDELDGGFDNTVDLLAGGAQADIYYVHFLDSHNVQLDGSPLAADIQPEALVQDGTDRLVYVPHDLQAARGLTLSNTGFDGDTASMSAGILDGAVEAEEADQAFAPGIIPSADELPVLLTADGDLWESMLRNSFAAEDQWHIQESDTNLALDLLFWESQPEPLAEGDLEAVLLTENSPSIIDALLESNDEMQPPIEEVDLVTLTNDISVIQSTDAAPLESADALLSASLSSSFTSSYASMFTGPKLYYW